MKKLSLTRTLFITFLLFVFSCSVSENMESVKVTDPGNQNLFSTSSGMIGSFTWYAYTSPAKDQIVMGPCHTFAATGLIEAMVKLYFNVPNYSLDLSEKHSYSILSLELGKALGVMSNDPYSSRAEATLVFAKEIGLVQESDYPYQPDPGQNNFYFGGVPDRVRLNNSIYVKIPGYTALPVSSGTDLKQKLLKHGPMALSMSCPQLHSGTGHGYLLIGWRTASSGATEWEFLDSWPQAKIDYNGNSRSDPDYLGRHYFTAVDIIPYINHAFIVEPVVGSRTITCAGLTERKYHDNDKDSYYVWGIGPKPAGCPGFAEQDGDDSNPALGPRDENGYCKVIPVKQSISVVSRGSYAVKNFTVLTTGTFYWDHVCYDIPNTGYYMRISSGGTTYVLSDKDHKTRRGSFTATAGKTYLLEIRGGEITSGGYTTGFYGSLTFNN